MKDNVVSIDEERHNRKTETVDERKKRKQREYNKRYQRKLRMRRRAELKLQASKKVPKKARHAVRTKKRRGLPVKPAKSQAHSILAGRSAEAISLLREATNHRCSCGKLFPQFTKSELLTMLARHELERGE